MSAQKKLLYDIEQLITSNNKETGICRVSLEILRQVSQRKDYQVFPLVTTDKGADAVSYLKSKGLDRLANNIVSLPKLKKSAAKHTFYQKMRAFLKELKFKKSYLDELNKFDEYISIFSPISPIVYASQVKTKIIVHDLIPFFMPQSCHPKFVAKFRYWIKSIQADEVICVSQSTKKDFMKYRPDYQGKIIVSHLAAGTQFVPMENKAIKEKYNIKENNYILSVSDHNPRKNFIHLIKAFIRFLEIVPQSKTVLVITGPNALDSENIKKLLEENPLYKNRIILTGYLTDKDLPALYSMAQMFIFPSLYEGFGLPVLEAMKCGCPVICSNNSSLPEIAGKAAFYISGSDIEETAQSMLTLTQNASLRAQMIEEGFVQAAKFNWENTTNKIFNKEII